MRKQLTRVIVKVMDAALSAADVEGGTQFKVVERVLSQKGLLSEKKSLQYLLDAIVEELVVAREETI